MKASIIIPTYNASERLYNTLIALKHQACPKGTFEVILVNNGSTDDTAQMLSNLELNYKLSVITLPYVNSRAYARNKGIMEAENELIIFHDSDMLARTDFVSSHIQSHRDKNTVVCGSLWYKVFTYYYKDYNNEQKELLNKKLRIYFGSKSIAYWKDKQPILKMDQLRSKEYKRIGYCGESFFEYQLRTYRESLDDYPFRWICFVTRNCSLHKDNLMKVGLFDEGFDGWGYEDSDMGFRLYKAGSKFIINPEIISLHQEHPKSLEDINTADKNLKFFLDKHETINPSLFFLYKLAGIKFENVYFIMKDIEKLQSLTEHEQVVTIFQKALTDLKLKVYENTTSNINYKSGNFDFKALYEYKYFVDALVKVLYAAYGENINE